MEIARAAVLGAGTMGSAIAAHFANAGIPVALLDVIPGAADRAVERMKTAEPPPFMHRSFAGRVRPGTLPHDLTLLADADWIVEAVVEDAALKQGLYRTVDRVRKPGSVVTSNTSTIPLARLVDGMPPGFAADFLITHFFNPPRYMRLLEVVTGPATRADAAAAVTACADRRLGKGIVHCHDTPGFVANRIGAFFVNSGINAALDLGLTVPEADAVAGKPIGLPKTGLFGLMDLVGLDLMPYVSASLCAHLPADDPFIATCRPWPLLLRLIADGYTGRKGKGGFYRLSQDGRRTKEVIDLRTGTFGPVNKPQLDSLEAARGGLKALVEHPDRGGRFADAVLVDTLAYAAALVPSVTEDPAAIDRAMRLGYNWRAGPFEMIDQLGSGWLVAQLTRRGRPIPALLTAAAGRPFYRVERGRLTVLTAAGDYSPVVRPDGVLLLADLKRAQAPMRRSPSANLWDIGDGVLCLEFTGKMNALDSDVLALLQEAIGLIEQGRGRCRALVIYNEGENFSVGANLGLALFVVNVALWSQLEEMVAEGQRVYRALRDAPFPVVAAPAGLALGGACELLMHCDAVQAHAESYIGLVETGVGLLPAWGGSKELLLRQMAKPDRPQGPMPAIGAAFETIGTAKVSKSAFEARDLLFLRPEDGVTMNRDRLLFDAKERALALAADYRPRRQPEPIRLPGPTGRTALELAVESLRLAGKATPHDATVATSVATVLSGGEVDITETVTEQDLLDLERREFMRLIRTPATVARIEHMLETGKPLRN